ncbi:PilZ domain-containing protein [Pseudoxanthomonas sp. 10H]|uniref:PilZ domain-containing protein n=1 Tax=Pseudoxanthomonas sp. 10H TaxID=3242729 RepID=UPI003556AA24
MTGSWPAAAGAADAALFDETLVCEAVLPAAFAPGPGHGQPLQAEALLRGLAQVEDLRGEDGGEEKRGELPALAQRMDAKLDLVLALLGRLVRQSAPVLPALPLRWSARGLRLTLPADPGLAAGTGGVVRLQPSEWLPDALELPATVSASAAVDGQFLLWLRFGLLPAALEDALERHLFRMHRREVAARRR